VAEDLVEPEAATANGYAQSKWVAEKMLEEAAKKGLDVQVVRVGQLAGAANGLWNIKEWLPALVQAGQVVGCLPQANGVGAYGWQMDLCGSLTDCIAS
jgi:thioester reductase-like protein